LAQGDFPFLSAGQKMKRINDYRTMQLELQRTRRMRDMLQNADVQKMTEMTNSFDSIQ
jgi:hypothetical protein